MTHVYLACKSEVVLCIHGVGYLCRSESGETLLGVFENLGDGVCPFCFFSKHVFIARHGVEFDACHAGAFLSAVVLLFHH